MAWLMYELGLTTETCPSVLVPSSVWCTAQEPMIRRSCRAWLWGTHQYYLHDLKCSCRICIWLAEAIHQQGAVQLIAHAGFGHTFQHGNKQAICPQSLNLSSTCRIRLPLGAIIKRSWNPRVVLHNRNRVCIFVGWYTLTTRSRVSLIIVVYVLHSEVWGGIGKFYQMELPSLTIIWRSV